MTDPHEPHLVTPDEQPTSMDDLEAAILAEALEYQALRQRVADWTATDDDRELLRRHERRSDQTVRVSSIFAAGCVALILSLVALGSDGNWGIYLAITAWIVSPAVPLVVAPRITGSRIGLLLLVGVWLGIGMSVLVTAIVSDAESVSGPTPGHVAP